MKNMSAWITLMLFLTAATNSFAYQLPQVSNAAGNISMILFGGGMVFLGTFLRRMFK